MSDRRRVVITGIGTVNAATAGGGRSLEALLARRSSGIRPVQGFPVEGHRSRLAAQVEPERLAALISPDAARRLSRICQLCVAACEIALRDAAITGGPELGIVVGSEHGDFRSSEEFALGFLRRGPAGLSPLIFPNTVMNTMASVAAIAIGAKGPSVTINQPTVAGDLAIARATGLILAGRADAVVAGGVDEITASVYRRLAELTALSPMGGDGSEDCRPYDRDHNGFVIGEGATFLVLEDQQVAHARGARVLAEVIASAWGTVPAPKHGARRTRADHDSPVHHLLRQAGQGVPRFARCYGSGNGDPAVDDWERALLARDLGEAPDSENAPPISLAPLVGQHGGLGALRVAAAAIDAAHGWSPILIHGIARGGCRTAIVVASPDSSATIADRWRGVAVEADQVPARHLGVAGA